MGKLEHGVWGSGLLISSAISSTIPIGCAQHQTAMPMCKDSRRLSTRFRSVDVDVVVESEGLCLKPLTSGVLETNRQRNAEEGPWPIRDA